MVTGQESVSDYDVHCVHCGALHRVAVLSYPDGIGQDGNVATRERVLNARHGCTLVPVHHAATMPGTYPLAALIDGARQARVSERAASTTGRHDYTATRPERLSDVHSGALTCVAYRPAARFVVTPGGRTYDMGRQS